MTKIYKGYGVLSVSGEDTDFDVLESIRKHIEQLKGEVGRTGLLCVGEYAIKAISRWSSLENVREILPVFIGRSREDIKRWSGLNFDSKNIIELKTRGATHFWFNVLSDIKNNERFARSLKNRSIHKREKSILAASIWDGVSSGLLPFLLSRLKEWGMDTVSIAILPSNFQPSDDHFNAASSIGISLAEDSAPILLIDRDNLENYVGVDRKGEVLKGNTALHYLLDLMLSRDSFIHELNELSRIFGVNNYAVLLASGASLRIYGSLKNILKSLMFRPLLTFNLSTSTIGYILFRLPIGLEGRVTKERIEREFSEWFEGKTSLKSLEVSDPVYVDDRNDRIDVAVFLGGFDKTETFAQMLKKSVDIARNAISRGLIEKDDWEKILGSLNGSG